MKRQLNLQKQGGVVLIEGLIAIVIFAFGVLAVIGMQAATVRQATDAKYRVDASFLASETLGRMWGNRNDLDSFEDEDGEGEAIAALPNGRRFITVVGTQVTIRITWQMPGEAAVRTYSLVTRING